MDHVIYRDYIVNRGCCVFFFIYCSLAFPSAGNMVSFRKCWHVPVGGISTSLSSPVLVLGTGGGASLVGLPEMTLHGTMIMSLT